MSQQKFDNLELEHLIGYSGRNYNTVLFHPQIQNLFICNMGGQVVIEDIQDKNNQVFLRGHDMPISALTISQSGKFIASGQIGTKFQKTPEAPVILWSFETKQQLHIFKGLNNQITNLSFSPDDKFLAATSQDNRLLIWSLQDNQVSISKQFEQPVGQSTSLILVTWDKVKRVGNHSSYSLITTLGGSISINEMDFSLATMQYTMKSQPCQMPNSSLIRNYTSSIIIDDFYYIGTTTGELLIFSIQYKVLKAIVPISNQGLLSICFANGSLYIGSGDGKIKKLRGQQVSWNQEAESQLQGSVISISVSQNQKELIVGTSLGNIYRCLATTLENMLQSESHTGAVNDICVRNKLDLFGTIDQFGIIFVWSLENLQVVQKLFPHGSCCCFTDDENEVMGGYSDGTIKCFQINDGRQRWSISAHKGNVTGIFCNQMYVLSGGADGIIRVWARNNRQLIIQYPAHTKDVTGIFPDIQRNNIIHSCSIDKSIFTFDLKTEKKVILHQSKNGFIYGMTQRKDREQELITCGQNMPIQFWDCDVVEPVEQIDFPMKLVTLEVSPSGRYLALGTEFGEIVLFNIEQNSYLGKYDGHTEQTSKLKWVNDEKQIISVSQDGSISVWNFFE